MKHASMLQANWEFSLFDGYLFLDECKYACIEPRKDRTDYLQTEASVQYRSSDKIQLQVKEKVVHATYSVKNLGMYFYTSLTMERLTALLVSYQYMKPASYGHLLYIDYMLLICHVYINGTSHSVEQFICDAALALGLHFARHFPSEADECLSFLRQSSYSPLAVLKHYFDMQLKNSNEGFDLPPPGIIRYLDQTLLNPSADIQWQISQKDDENMISFYKTWSPARLMYLVLTNKLSKESYAAVCDTLLTKKQLEDDRLLSMYTLTRLAVEEDPTLLNRIIKKLQQGHLRQILLFIPECLFCDAKLSPLGVILLTHIPDVVNDVLTSFIKQKHKCVENLVSSVKADTTAVDIHMKQQHTCPESL